MRRENGEFAIATLPPHLCVSLRAPRFDRPTTGPRRRKETPATSCRAPARDDTAFTTPRCGGHIRKAALLSLLLPTREKVAPRRRMRVQCPQPAAGAKALRPRASRSAREAPSSVASRHLLPSREKGASRSVDVRGPRNQSLSPRPSGSGRGCRSSFTELAAYRVYECSSAGGSWAAGEDWPWWLSQRATAGLDADHAVADVADGDHMVFLERGVEAGPAGAALELGHLAEQRQAANRSQ